MTALTDKEAAATTPEDNSLQPLQRIIVQLRNASNDASRIVEAATELDSDEDVNPQPDAVPDTTSPTTETVRQILFHVSWIVVLTILGMALMSAANKRFAPFLLDDKAVAEVAEAFAAGKNYAVFDLNIDIRDLRNAHIATFEKAPEVVMLGASHWQEAHSSLLPDHDFYNSHVHRDYYEDMLAVTEMYIRHGKLPQKMIITIRDNLFTPIPERTDFLWLPGIKYYRVMALRLGLEPHSKLETLPVETWKEMLSFRFLQDNMARELFAPVLPHATRDQDFHSLDTLLPDGSIRWSKEHLDMFTAERSEREALAFADAKRNAPPQIDPKGLEAIDALLRFLTDQGVEVYLAHPPFNPLFFDAVRDTPYERGLERVKDITRQFADKYDISIIGSFDPSDVGCTHDMYIDAEHSGPECLVNIFNEFADLDRMRHAAPEPAAGNQ